VIWLSLETVREKIPGFWWLKKKVEGEAVYYSPDYFLLLDTNACFFAVLYF
jgi:hypothetical protein